MLGITVGVATVLAMMAVGAGAQRSIEQQVRAAGLNQITIRAGNWRPKVTDSDEAVAHQGDARESLKHPLASPQRRCGQDRVPSGRRSDGEARSPDRAPAPRRSRSGPRLGGDDDVRRCRGDSRVAGRAVRGRRHPRKRPRAPRQETLVHAHARHRRDDAVDQARVDVHRRPVLHRARAEPRRAGDRAGTGGGRSVVCRRRQPGGRRR